MVIDVTKPYASMSIDEFFHEMELSTMQLCYEFILDSDIDSYVNESIKLDNTTVKNAAKNGVQKLTDFIRRIIKKINEIFDAISTKVIEMRISTSEKILEKMRDKSIGFSFSSDKKSWNFSGNGNGALGAVVVTIVDRYIDQGHKFYNIPKNASTFFEENNDVKEGYSSSLFMDQLEIKDDTTIKDLVKKDIVSYLSSLKSLNAQRELKDLKAFRDKAIEKIRDSAALAHNLTDNNTKDQVSAYRKDIAPKIQNVMNKYAAVCKCYYSNIKNMLQMATMVANVTNPKS